jgi:hypothetical protein
MPNFYYAESTHYSYNSYDRQIVFSSESARQRSYADEYDWFEEVCEEFGAEPEAYED